MSSIRTLVTAIFFAICVVFGGGGSPSPFSELIVELAALIAVGVFFLSPQGTFAGTIANPIDWRIFAGAAALVALPLLQLVPLPPAIWHLLPNREVERASLELIGLGQSWQPLSIAPYDTFASALSLIPPVAMLVLVSRLTLDERTGLLMVFSAMVFVAATVGLVQLSSGSANWLRFYSDTQYGYATGFQANRNADADILLIGMLAIAALAALHRQLISSRSSWIMFMAVALFLAASVIATGSRAGVSLLLVAAAAMVSILIPHRPKFTTRTTVLGLIGIAIVVGGVAAMSLEHNNRLEKTWRRFSRDTDARTTNIWPDALFASRESWPIGTGVGTFVSVFEAGERLQVVDQSTPNRAHNDYLEFSLEAGLAGVLLLAVALLALAWRTVSILRNAQSHRYRTHALFGAGTIVILGLHSLVDYPMRSMSLATLCGMAVGMLSSISSDRGRRHRGGINQEAQSSVVEVDCLG